ncbi:hypothetical protein ABT294_03290 [Nonomuraea sp. NPDC000554]|uniref:hypothetical protein n=1 Tax=Nonomuraea sp. NPDC000554 TaxID=3154259 RepID=UPI00333031FA
MSPDSWNRVTVTNLAIRSATWARNVRTDTMEPHEVWENATHLRDLTAELDTIGVQRHWPVPTGY